MVAIGKFDEPCARRQVMPFSRRVQRRDIGAGAGTTVGALSCVKPAGRAQCRVAEDILASDMDADAQAKEIPQAFGIAPCPEGAEPVHAQRETVGIGHRVVGQAVSACRRQLQRRDAVRIEHREPMRELRTAGMTKEIHRPGAVGQFCDNGVEQRQQGLIGPRGLARALEIGPRLFEGMRQDDGATRALGLGGEKLRKGFRVA